jgi:hypothetical protein
MTKKYNSKIGDEVTSHFRDNEKEVIRKITHIRKDKGFEGGYEVSADGGKICSECKRRLGHPINNVCITWFKPIEKQEIKNE